MDAHLYYHSPCFDGIVSAVIASGFLRRRQGWPEPRLQAVNYDRRSDWLATPLPPRSAVVDFLYHPDATFWADHHPTSFLTDEARRHFSARGTAEYVVYDETAPSCAGLLRKYLAERFAYRDESRDSLVDWAEKTDAARYDSVQEAVEARAPALRIAAGLSLPDDGGYCNQLVRLLYAEPLEAVAESAEVRRRADEVAERSEIGLQRVRDAIKIVGDGIAFFDVDSAGATVNRYAPFYWLPDARYSVGIVRSARGAKLTTMRNPWREFESVHLGKLCAGYGGGGHQRVGSIVFDGARAGETTAVARSIIEAIGIGSLAD